MSVAAPGGGGGGGGGGALGYLGGCIRSVRYQNLKIPLKH